MADYNLGRAHGTIKIDYDNRGVKQANQDVDNLGKTSETSSQKITQSATKVEADFATMGNAAKRLEQEVTRAAASEVAARARLAVAEQQLSEARARSTTSAKQLSDAEKQVQSAQERVAQSSQKLTTSHQALANVRRQLSAQRFPDLIPNDANSKFDQLLGHIKGIDTSTRKSSGVLNTFRSRLGIMIAGIALASPAVAGLGVALVSLAGLAGVATGALAGLAAIGATIATAFSGVSEVFKLSGKQAASAGSSAAAAADQQRAAARQIEQALRSVRDAQENLGRVQDQVARATVAANREIISATHALRDAQTDAKRAQDQLTQARQQATRSLEDMRAAVRGGALDERQAIIDVQRAQDELARTLNDPRSTQLDRDQAELTLEKQKEQLENLRTSNQRLGVDSAEAAAKGVSGADSVISANDAILHSNEQLEQAQFDLGEATANAARTQADSQVQIRDAFEAVADAQRDLKEAYLSASAAGGGGASAMQDALANVSPEVRKLIAAVDDQREAWKSVKFAVQDALFKDLADSVKPLANQWFPLLKTGMSGIATELNLIVKDIIQFLMTSDATSDVSTIFENIRLAVHNLGPALRNILEIFFDLSTVGSGFLPDLATKFTNLTERLKNFVQQSRESGAMQEWIHQAIEATKQLFRILGNIASIVGTVFSAFDTAGGGFLNTLEMATDKIDKFLKSAEGQEILHALATTLATLAKVFVEVAIGGLALLAPIFTDLAPLIQEFAKVLGAQILVTLQILQPILQAFVGLLTVLGPVLIPLVASFVLLNKAIAIANTVWGFFNKTVKANPFVAVAAIVIALATIIITHWEQIKTAIFTAWEAIKTAAEVVWNAIRDFIITPIKEAIDNVIQFFTDFWNGLKAKWDQLVELTKNATQVMVDTFVKPIKEGIDNVIEFFGNIQGWIGDKLRDAGQWLLDVGRNIVDGLLRGLKNAINKVWDWIGDIGEGIANAFANVLSIFSPSKVFAELGEFTMQGYVVGLDRMETPVINRVIEIAQGVAAAGQPPVTTPTVAASRATVTPVTPAGTTITIGALTLNVAGNLDPTNPTEFKQTIKRIKKAIESDDLERV